METLLSSIVVLLVLQNILLAYNLTRIYQTLLSIDLNSKHQPK